VSESLSVPDGELGFDLLAGSLRASSADLSTFVEVLGDKLEQALPHRVTIGRRAVRALSRRRRIVRIEVAFGDSRYLLTVDRGSIDTRLAKAVRGVVLKSEPLSRDAWIDGLAHGLASEARASEQSRLALQRALGV
jgi:hypothetical protein